MKPSGTLETRVKKTLALLAKKYSHAHCALHHENAFQLLIATILSAQCTDERVNQVTAVLFSHYPTPQALAESSLKDIEAIIRPTGFFKNKAKNIKSSSRTLVDKYQGQVPKTMEELIILKGVGRKTANVVLGNAFGIISGVVVDTHVARLSKRLGWSKGKNPEEIERDLQALVPEKNWIDLSHWLIWHGRQICKARKPNCEKCFLFDHCPQIGV